MYADIRLENLDGSLHRRITPGEAKRLKGKGDITRISARAYRLVERAHPSTSKISMPVITLSDMLKVVGVQRLTKDREEQDIERLIGFGLLPENVIYPVHGYLG